MIPYDVPQSFLFTFRSNGEAHGELMVEVLVEQLADYDPSPADDAYQRRWFGAESALLPMLEGLGFEAFDIRGVQGALKDHRGADRRLTVTPEQLDAAGFQQIDQPNDQQ